MLKGNERTEAMLFAGDIRGDLREFGELHGVGVLASWRKPFQVAMP